MVRLFLCLPAQHERTLHRMNDIAYRILFEADIEAFRTLRRVALERHPEAFSETVEEFDSTSDDELRDFVCRRSSPTHKFVYGAFDGNNLIGIAGCYQQKHTKLRHMGSVWSVYVDPAYRAKRVGRELMRRLIDQARSIEELKLLELGVAESSVAAKHLYESLGFFVSGLEEGAMKVGDRYVNMFFMRLWLHGKPGNIGASGNVHQV